MPKINKAIILTIIFVLLTLLLTACKTNQTSAFPRHNLDDGSSINPDGSSSSSGSGQIGSNDSIGGSSGEQGNLWGDYPAPTFSSYIAIPPPVDIYPQPEDQINFLLLGSDQRPDDTGFRTDAILLGTVNFNSKEVNLVSIPRDLYVYIPGYAMDRINTALFHGKEETLHMTYEYNFGVEIDNYMIINFDGFKNLVDTLGGIDVIAAVDMTDKHPTEGEDFLVPAGLNHMNGETALFYVRARKNSSDFDRARRQQEVIRALLDRLLKFDVITLIPDLYAHLDETIQTDLSLEDIFNYALMLPDFAEINDLSMYKIGSDHTSPWINPSNGASVLLPDYDAIESIIQQSINYSE
jgi:LCP family protein required for cell wall assembly